MCARNVNGTRDFSMYLAYWVGVAEDEIAAGGNPFTVAADRRCAERTLEKLADLIDRPTCRDLVEHKQDPFVPGKRSADGFFHCSACGWHGRIYEYIGFGDMATYEAVCCPKCGKEIER